jgi:hypothetical protein
MRHLATLRRIKELRPIPNADRIEVALIDGWEVVVNKSDGFKVGDMVVYVEIDSILPDRPEFEFMRKYKFRVKTIKLRGQVSQGLVLPASILANYNYDWLVASEHDDVTDIIGITKYDPEAVKEKVWWQKLAAQTKVVFPWWLKPFKRIKFIREWWINKHKAVDSFPPFIKKTDEERIQNMPILFDELRKGYVSLSVTEKMDGTSATYFLKDGKFGVCSRNKWLLKEDDSPYWQVANKYQIEETLRTIAFESGCKLCVLQGEIIGQSIQKNKYHLSGFMFMPFNLVFDGKRLNYHDMKEWLSTTMLNCVPELDNDFIVPPQWEIADIVEYAKGTSLYRDGKEPREGIVCRNEEKHISFKVINPDFLLKEDA